MEVSINLSIMLSPIIMAVETFGIIQFFEK